MSVQVGLDIAGADEMVKVLESISRALSKAILKQALMKAGSPMTATAVRFLKAQVRNYKGVLLGRTQTGVFIGSVLSRNQRRGNKTDRDAATIYIGPYKARHAHLIEFGTGPRRNKAGANRGALRPRPFMRPAWEQHKHQILSSLGEEIWGILKADAAKIAKSQKRTAAARLRAQVAANRRRNRR